MELCPPLDLENFTSRRVGRCKCRQLSLSDNLRQFVTLSVHVRVQLDGSVARVRRRQLRLVYVVATRDRRISIREQIVATRFIDEENRPTTKSHCERTAVVYRKRGRAMTMISAWRGRSAVYCATTTTSVCTLSHRCVGHAYAILFGR